MTVSRRAGRSTPSPGTQRDAVTAVLDIAAVAARIGATPATVRSYRTRGYLPAPDVILGQSPGWLPETVEAWIAGRPGKGAGAGRPPGRTKAAPNP